ncbi:SMI1/KNR4 family protein, partial [Arsenicibacter rosenii]|uniref:SMI1/KNR4 family protein n=1 Tax=Arsenicibacter rosenii TaxID=1750698 RepID=UPI001C43537B
VSGQTGPPQPAGQPVLEEVDRLPDDLVRFYELCGGVTLFMGQSGQIRIVRPAEFVRANPVIVGELCQSDRSYEWFIVASDDNGQYVTFDLSTSRSGWCYDSFWDRHGVPGQNDILAHSFIGFLNLVVLSEGVDFYWFLSDFVSLGDAYS